MSEGPPPSPLLRRDRGPRFAARVGWPTGPGWVAATELFGPGLARALDDTAADRGTPHAAVAGSLLVEQYAQRLVPPVLGALLAEGRTVDASLAQVRVRWRAARIAEVAVAGPVEETVEITAPAVALLERNLAPAIEAVHRRAGTGRRVLRGAVAHAAAVTALHLSWPERGPSRHPEAVREVLAAWGMADLVTLETVEHDGDPWLYADRRSCCLVFRAADHQGHDDPYCATCPIVPELDRRRSFHAAVDDFRRRHG